MAIAKFISPHASAAECVKLSRSIASQWDAAAWRHFAKITPPALFLRGLHRNIFAETARRVCKDDSRDITAGLISSNLSAGGGVGALFAISRFRERPTVVIKLR
jgi:hypothetical protein